MSLLSTSNSKGGWRRLRRELFRLLLLLLLLELVVRVNPVKSLLSEALDPYQNLLWYDKILPAYQDQIESGQTYDVWLVGSSYMMTGLQPEWVQAELEDGLTVQNYGMADMRNLFDMAEVYDQWLLGLDQPDYVVMGISVFNFSFRMPSTVRNSPMERTYIFPDSLDDYGAGWLFRNSALFRYSLLARNATFIAREDALLEAHPLGGFIESSTPFENCNPDEWQAPDIQREPYPREFFAALDRFLEVFQSRGIPVMVVDIPLQYCNMRRYFASYEAYDNLYLQPISAILQAKGVPFLNLAPPFYADVPEDEQKLYFMDHHHPNTEGARLFSRWTGAFAAAWIKSQ